MAKKPETDRPKSTRERLAEKKSQAPKKDEKHLTVGQRTRGIMDALVFAFVLAMFIRSFVFELFMIPTGSMTPTLIGDQAGTVAFIDYDGDGTDDVVSAFATEGGRPLNILHIYLMNPDGSYRDQVFLENVPHNSVASVLKQSKARRDMIIVNKFAYWFSPPERGDIAVFKVPHRPPAIEFELDKPVYIKRVIGLPGDTITFLPPKQTVIAVGEPGRIGDLFGGDEIHIDAQPLHANGKAVDDGIFQRLMHYPRPTRIIPDGFDLIQNIPVPEDGVLMIGDNAASSKDGRYFGHVPLSHLRGEAIFRYLPLNSIGFLK
jgi:signal peptidase I